ncbi:MAG: RNA polymerase sigma factor for flagellar operon FliA [Moritella sp.]
MNKASAYSSMQQQPSDVVEQFGFLVKRIAHHLLLRLPASVQLDDLIQSGMIGLLDAARNFDGTKGASFETYAGIRIRGSMIDEMRRGDWVPRSVHKNGRNIAAAIDRIEKKSGADAKDTDIAEELGVSLSQYHSMLMDVNSGHILAVEDLTVNNEDAYAVYEGQSSTPFTAFSEQRFQHALAKCIKTLPERESLVLSLYYDEELNLREIGEVLDVSESRVSQIHSQAMHRVKARMHAWLDD